MNKNIKTTSWLKENRVTAVILAIALIALLFSGYYYFQIYRFRQVVKSIPWGDSASEISKDADKKRDKISINQVFKEQGYDLQITSVTRVESYNDEKVGDTIKSKNGEFVMIKISGKNQNSQPTALEDAYLLLRDKDGKVYQMDHSYQSGGCLMCLSNPGATNEETFVWDITKGLSGLVLLTDSSEIDLKL